jgi:uncharacterized membrane protein
MTGIRIARGLFVAIALAAIAQCAHDFPLLPDRLASHFNAAGTPNGWMSKTQFLWVYALVLIPALAIEFWVSRKIASKSDAQLNLPHKEYWLAPKRRAATFAYFESFCAWYGCAFLFVVAFAMGLAMRANFDSPPMLPTAPILMDIVGFFVFNIAAVILMLRRFSLPR